MREVLTFPESFGIFRILKPLATSSGQGCTVLLCQVPSCWPASAAQNHTLLRRGSAGRLWMEPKFSACQKFTEKPNKHKTRPDSTVHLSPGVPDASPAAGGHATNDPQLLLHNPKPAHHHTTVPPATGQHHPSVCPAPAPALLQLPATAAAAKVSIQMVAQNRLLVEGGALDLLTAMAQVMSQEDYFLGEEGRTQCGSRPWLLSIEARSISARMDAHQ